MEGLFEVERLEAVERAAEVARLALERRAVERPAVERPALERRAAGVPGGGGALSRQ